MERNVTANQETTHQKVNVRESRNRMDNSDRIGTKEAQVIGLRSIIMNLGVLVKWLNKILNSPATRSCNTLYRSQSVHKKNLMIKGPKKYATLLSFQLHLGMGLNWLIRAPTAPCPALPCPVILPDQDSNIDSKSIEVQSPRKQEDRIGS